jgi:hypothetical protein
MLPSRQDAQVEANNEQQIGYKYLDNDHNSKLAGGFGGCLQNGVSDL